MMKQLVELVQRLNLSDPQNLVGAHFHEILSLLSIVFGGSFLLYSWKQKSYFLGAIGFLIGGWGGLFLRTQLSPQGEIAPFLYLGLCAVAGAFLAVSLQRMMGMLLGGFTVTILLTVLAPNMMRPDQSNLASLCLAFLLGGGLGAIFPKFFYIFNSALIGAIFVTYGISQAILQGMTQNYSSELQTFLHLAVFLPLFLFGMIYQLAGREDERVAVFHQDPQHVRA